MVRVIQCDRHIGIAQRLAHLRSRKNDILHGCTTELFDPLFSQYPTYRICHITLTTAVWSNDSGNTVVELKGYLICKGFKALHLYTF